MFRRRNFSRFEHFLDEVRWAICLSFELTREKQKTKQKIDENEAKKMFVTLISMFVGKKRNENDALKWYQWNLIVFLFSLLRLICFDMKSIVLRSKLLISLKWELGMFRSTSIRTRFSRLNRGFSSSLFHCVFDRPSSEKIRLLDECLSSIKNDNYLFSGFQLWHKRENFSLNLDALPIKHDDYRS